MKKIAFVFVALCIAASAYAQGMYWQSKTEGGIVGERMTDMFAMPKKFMSVTKDNKGNTTSIMVVRLDKELMWNIDPKKKTYSETTLAELEGVMKKAGGKMDAAMAKMQKEMENMSPEQRKMVEGMMKGEMPGMGTNDATVEVTNTGDKKTISGFSCTKYVAKQGNDVIMTLWTTKEVKGFDDMRKDWEEYSRRWASMTPRFGKEMAEAYKEIQGFPIQTELGHGVTTTVTKVERRSTPAGEFEIPAGYTKVESEMKKSMENMEQEDQ